VPDRPHAGDRPSRSGQALSPLYSLYGDRSGARLDFVHIEPLRDRSELFDWSIEPHTHAALHQVVLLFGGRVEVALDEHSYDLAAPGVVVIPAGVVHSFEFEPDSAGFVLAIAEAHLDGSPIGSSLRSLLFEEGMSVGLGHNDVLATRLNVLAGEIMREQESVDIGRTATIDWLTRTVLVLLARESSRFEHSGSGARSSDLFRDFQNLVEHHYIDHWPVAKYASSLHISESSLNRLCRTVSATTAFEIIRARLETEARRRLIYSPLPIQRIAGDLGFADPSYFSRFFRGRTGLAPREFRAGRHTVPDRRG